MKKKIFISVVLVLISAIIALGAYAVYKQQNTPNTQMVSFFDMPGTRLIIGSELITGEEPPIIRDSQIHLSLDTVKAHIDPYIWWDEALQKITITTKDRVVRMKTGSLDALVNDEPMVLTFPAVLESGVVYLPIDFLKDFYGIEITYVEANDVVIIDPVNKIYQIGCPLGVDPVVRKGMSIKEPIVKQFVSERLSGEMARLIVFAEYEDWYYVRTADGILGYMQKDQVVKTEMIVTRGSTLPGEDTAPGLPQGKLSLVWDMTYSKKNIEFSSSNTPGIDVISPTWFEIVDQEGTIKNRADAAYVDWAHQNGWQVWAHIANDYGDLDGTSLILNNSDKRQEIIRQILAYAALYDVDGINLDFENIYKKDKDAYTQLVREFYPLLKEQGLTVSVAVSVPGGSDTWSLCYDRKALAESVDYVCLMTYDQHWGSSPVAGSTAELNWVESMLEATLREVPTHKLLLGVPLYTRIWTEEVVDGKTKVSSKAYGVERAWQAVEENEAVAAWNPVGGQYEASFEKDGKVQKLWIEDADAVNAKTSLVHKYQLAGACLWAANFADTSVWPVLDRNLKEVAHYDEWKQQYSQPSR
jgi:spore germination protein YaaH